jgi:hypothetical protein
MVSNENNRLCHMRFSSIATLSSLLLIGSLAFGQESRKPSNELLSPSLELKLINSPHWTSNCLELSFQRTNVSKSSIFLNAMFKGVKVYSSVHEPPNTTVQGSSSTWMLVYGWTDVVSEPVELVPGRKEQDTICIDGTFSVKQTRGETLRQVRLQGKLRIVTEYEIPTWKTIDQPQGSGRRSYVRTVDKSGHWTFNEIVMEVPIPCPTSTDTPDCSSPAEISPGEHDVHTIEPEPPPTIQNNPPQPSTLPIDGPTPPKPQALFLVTPAIAKDPRYLPVTC